MAKTININLEETYVPPGITASESPNYADAVWHDMLNANIDGCAWDDVNHPSDRLPARAEGKVRQEVWDLAQEPAGLSVLFETNAKEIFVRWELARNFSPPNRSAWLHQGGLDLYGKDTDDLWYWVGAGVPMFPPKLECRINRDPLDGQNRLYRLYLPMRIRITQLEIGIPQQADFSIPEPDKRKPFVYYGSSIVHGAGVSRPGMAHAAMLQRALDYPMIPLGLSGNAKFEPEVAEFIAEIDASLFILDGVPNVGAETVRERVPEFVRILRNSQPDTPILLVSTRLFGDAKFIPKRHQVWQEKNAALKKVFQELTQAGNKELYLLPEGNYFGDDFDGTDDGSHPNGLGAWRMAQSLIPAVKDILTTEMEKSF